ncbi:hypothetical protein Trco_005941 [Trichoderma cornu-damae]|uniref:Uncharacterized protein n=1 Tax=Trichoderma cornu-damae TaxID=654480 RepID=A0A9P8TVV6_9HYPO|nr:hypothetical protein Trco_005941 [Trichoderma cornu-damae]
MFFSKACFALEALCLAVSLLQHAGAAPQHGIWSTVMNPFPFVSISFSVSTTTEEATWPTSGAWSSSAEETGSSQHTQSPRTSRSCSNIVCLPLSPWTKSEAQPTSTPVAASASACSHVSSPSQTHSAMRFNFTETCDGSTDMAEDCRVTLDCDASRGLYPTCERGKCQCLAKACFRRSTCLGYRQCREFDEHVCIEGGHNTDGAGTCFDCTERHFSLYPEFPYCSTGDSKYPLGRCECRPFDCFRTGDGRDYEACKDLVACHASPLGPRPYCSLKYGEESKGAADGYCTCGS